MRKVVLTLCMLAILTLALGADVRPAAAIGGVSASSYVCSYYSDATYTTVVGARGTGCCGEPISWGVITVYKKCQILECLDVICPDTV